MKKKPAKLINTAPAKNRDSIEAFKGKIQTKNSNRLAK